MRKSLFLSLVFIVFTLSSYAQRSEGGLFVGGSYYLGDLNPNIHFGNTSPAFGVVYRYNLSTRWAFKLNALYGNLKGADSSSVGWNKQRNLSFESKVLDFSAQIELNFFPYYTGSSKYTFTPYIFTGISVFSFNPKAKINGDWYDLQPLGTEGQGTTAYPGRKSYALTQLSMPFGVGVKWSISKLICLGFEWGMRKTFTDYLDDVSTSYPDPIKLEGEKGTLAMLLSNRSIEVPGKPPIVAGMQRGNSKTKDWYSFAGLTFTIKISGNKDKGCRDFHEPHRYDDVFQTN